MILVSFAVSICFVYASSSSALSAFKRSLLILSMRFWFLLLRPPVQGLRRPAELEHPILLRAIRCEEGANPCKLLVVLRLDSPLALCTLLPHELLRCPRVAQGRAPRPVGDIPFEREQSPMCKALDDLGATNTLLLTNAASLELDDSPKVSRGLSQRTGLG